MDKTETSMTAENNAENLKKLEELMYTLRSELEDNMINNTLTPDEVIMKQRQLSQLEAAVGNLRPNHEPLKALKEKLGGMKKLFSVKVIAIVMSVLLLAFGMVIIFFQSMYSSAEKNFFNNFRLQRFESED